MDIKKHLIQHEILDTKDRGFNDNRYVNTTGDLMTGGLTIQPATDVLTGLVVNDKDANNVLTVDTINNRVGVGVSEPGVALDIIGTSTRGTIYSSTTSGRFQWNSRKARGTSTVPKAVENGDALGAYGFQGYDGTDYQQGGMVQAAVDDVVSAGNVPTALYFVTGTNATTRTTRLKVSSGGNVGIGTTSPTQKLDVVGSGKFSVNVLAPEIKTDTAAPTDLTITTGAAKTLVLATPVYNDLYTAVAAAKVPAVGYPDWSTFTTNTGAYTFKVDDYADLSTIEVLHDYKEGTDLEVHLHLATNGLNNATARKVKYMVYYTWANPDQGTNQFSAEDSLTAELDIPANQPDKSAYYLSLGTITGTNMKIGAQIKFRVKRIASTGTEPIGNPFLGMVGIHYQIDTAGSRSISDK